MDVPVTTAVKRKRAHNVDTARLLGRRSHLIERVMVRFEGSRADFAVRAFELQAIENVLVHRGALAEADRRTSHGNDLTSGAA